MALLQGRRGAVIFLKQMLLVTVAQANRECIGDAAARAYMGCCLLCWSVIFTVDKQVLLQNVTVALAYRECIGTLLQEHTWAAAACVCP